MIVSLPFIKYQPGFSKKNKTVFLLFHFGTSVKHKAFQLYGCLKKHLTSKRLFSNLLAVSIFFLHFTPSQHEAVSSNRRVFILALQLSCASTSFLRFLQSLLLHRSSPKSVFFRYIYNPLTLALDTVCSFPKTCAKVTRARHPQPFVLPLSERRRFR